MEDICKMGYTDALYMFYCLLNCCLIYFTTFVCNVQTEKEWAFVTSFSRFNKIITTYVIKSKFCYM